METVVDLVGSVPLFERLDRSIQEQIEAISELVTAEEGEVLSLQGAMPEFLHVLLEGQVALTSTAADGTTAVVEVIHPVGHFVMASVLSELPYLMTARAVARSRLLAIDAAALLALVHRDPL